MSAPLRKALLLLLFPAGLAAFFAAAYLSFYSGGGYTPPEAPDIAFAAAVSYPVETAAFADDPVFDTAIAADRGLLLVDFAHRNAFYPEELAPLTARVAGRGYEIAYLEDPDQLEEQLRAAAALLVILPIDAYSPAAAAAVADFAARGGRVLLIADPGRPHYINYLAEPLGISFPPDYLYNQTEYDTNFQEIFVRDFQADAVTSGLDEIALYYAGSVDSVGPGLAFSGGNTYSSLSELPVALAPIALGANPNILALHDLTFMIPPYNGVRDNDRFLSNLADFLTDGQLEYRLTDYPHFFRGEVDVLLGRPELFAQGAELKDLLADQGINADLRGLDNGGRDTIFLGLYDDAAAAAPYLDALGIYVYATAIDAPFAPGLPREGTALLALYRAGDRIVLVILAATPEGLDKIIGQLDSGDFRRGLAADYAGVYKTE